MYDHPGQRAANDVLWSAIARHLRRLGIAAPNALDRTRSVEAIWRDPNLLLAQCCGYPLVADPDLALRVIAMPVYALPDCPPGRHYSRILVRDDDPATSLEAFAGRRVAINAPFSNTGANLLRAAVAQLGPPDAFFGRTIVTGSHRASIDAVASDRADIAAIDAVTAAVIARDDPAALHGLRDLARTPRAPNLPFVTARTTPPAVVGALREALHAAMRNPALAPARAALLLTDIVPASIHRYRMLARIGRGAPERAVDPSATKVAAAIR
ncbi:phosphate ABC transporter substrate-binding protein [Arthrobacter sp. TPD3018]|nr:phosphate ABC transporter substrate-binding protein [Sphingomonas sp. TPD3009]PVE52996.1 phosphate ABC transporter substrate-binding protein [Arthrobacter sp. TPD3018]PVE81382.1 phosphate ABC transporter substrate-binding protein [Sphingomonas melonis]